MATPELLYEELKDQSLDPLFRIQKIGYRKYTAGYYPPGMSCEVDGWTVASTMNNLVRCIVRYDRDNYESRHRQRIDDYLKALTELGLIVEAKPRKRTTILHQEDPLPGSKKPLFVVRRLSAGEYQVEYNPTDTSAFQTKGISVARAYDSMLENLSRGHHSRWSTEHEPRCQALLEHLISKMLIEG